MILVTGGAGFIGSHIVDQLIAAGERVRVLDMLGGAADDAAEALSSEAELIVADVRDADAVAAALDGVSAVCHQAAMVGLGVDLLDMPDYVASNDLGTAVLLAELARRRFDGRFVLASSMVVYGEGRYRCATHGLVAAPPRAVTALGAGRFEPACPDCGAALVPESIPESAAVDPRNVYAATKLHQEHLAFSFARETGVPVTALRYHNVYGPRMPRNTPYAGVAAIFASALADGRAPRVFEDGGQLRDFIHVRDVARANVLALTAPRPVPGCFNIATGHPHSILEMARALSRAFAAAPAPEVTGEYRLGDVRHVFAAADLAREQLGFRAEIDFATGMAEFADTAMAA